MKSPDGRECSTFLRHKKIALTGKRTTKVYLLNPDERTVEKIQVDDCAINDGPRCDWLILLDRPFPKEEIYVELKASHVSRGVEQIEATVKKLSADAAQLPIRCLVVFRRRPKIGTDAQKYAIKFRRKFNAVFNLVSDKDEVAL